MKYEEVMNKPESQLKNMVDFLGWAVDDKEIKEVVVNRVKKVMPIILIKAQLVDGRVKCQPRKLKRLRGAFRPFLEETGYEIEP